ncbi:ABC transporter substrate-binding protein [Natrialba asiatica]|uniref:Fe3+-hydroxamate ABC transporter periplasmic component-like protein n=1 Tax=Natrialba asiatica (strain ATCC 700177 / DSM 12278 / JCM 9576 / FERM P-10747 / NBRC 102637 / 172P1) TaxID=29540 RepID=M0ALT1_NATA1|nr:ABC transporter substrate-binding protein [Natrialba asiatica]ELY99306.1 Fe3+-hydroxamate ABC transporter periplasmic component-like protein [Natrialba asiatica DSM 12278]
MDARSAIGQGGIDRSRRRFVAASTALGSAMLAGCISGRDDPTGNGHSNGDGHTATLQPMGDVSFDAVPERVFVAFPQYADMAVALGHGDAVTTLFSTEMSGTTMNKFYDRLPGVSFDWDGLPNPLEGGLRKEQLYELDSDVHFLDPSYVLKHDDWTEDDIDDIASTVGPWVGNFHSGVHSDPADAYADQYEFYTLWELFDRVTDVFQERERYAALEAVYDDLHGRIASNLPPEDERPTAARVTLGDGQFFTYHLNAPGYWQADTRPLAAADALADRSWSGDWGTVDYETMLDVDPDVILHLWGITSQYSIDDIRDELESHPVGSKLTAVQNDRVVAGGMRYQGPLMNLFQLEMTAKQLYPDEFGTWPGYEPGTPYPDIPEDERLFDRERVAAIIRGEF